MYLISINYIENENIILNVKSHNNNDEINLIFDTLKANKSIFDNNIFEIKYNGYTMFKIIDVLNTIINDIHKKKFFYNKDDGNYKDYNNYSDSDEDD